MNDEKRIWELYKLINESPDHVRRKYVDLKWNDYEKGEIYTFGFINIYYNDKKILLNLDQMDGQLLIKESNQFDGKLPVHNILVKQFFEDLYEGILILKNKTPIDFTKKDQKSYFLDNYYDLFSYNTKVFLKPTGRFWKNVNSKYGKNINIISFWDDENDYDYIKKIDSVLNHSGLKQEEKDLVYVEFPKDYIDYNSSNTEMYTFEDYKNKKEQKETIKDELTEYDIDLLNQLKQGAHGNELNPNFGSRKQVDIAKKSDYNTFAKYYAERHPFSESKNTYRK